MFFLVSQYPAEPKWRRKSRKKSKTVKGELLPLSPDPKGSPLPLLSLRAQLQVSKDTSSTRLSGNRALRKAPGKEIRTPDTSQIPCSKQSLKASRAWKWASRSRGIWAVIKVGDLQVKLWTSCLPSLRSFCEVLPDFPPPWGGRL